MEIRNIQSDSSNETTPSVCIYDKHGILISYNQHALDFLGLQLNKGVTWDEIWSEFSLQSYDGQTNSKFAAKDVFANGKSVYNNQVLLQRKDKDLFYLFESFEVHKDRDGSVLNIVHFFSKMRDELNFRSDKITSTKSEARFRALVTATSDIVYRMSPEWKVLLEVRSQDFISDTACPNLSWIEKYLPSDEQEYVLQVIRNAISNKSVFELEHRVLLADGSIGWTHSKAIPLLNEEGDITEWIGMASDVTARKRAENSIHESERRLRFIIGSMPQKICTTLPNGDVEYLNPIWESYSGFSPEKLRICGWSSIIHPDDLAESLIKWEQSIQTKAIFQHEQRLRRVDGEYRWHITRVFPVLDHFDKIVMWIGSSTDVHDLKLVTESLAELKRKSEQQKRLYETILNNTPDLVYVFDLNHRFTYANKALLTMWNRTWEDAIGKNCLELGYPEWHAAKHDNELEQVKETKQALRGDVPFLGPYGRRIYDYIFVPVLNAKGDVEAIAGTTRDITDLKNMENKLLKAARTLGEADRRKDEFLAILSHELRSPLNVICGYVELLKMEGQDCQDFKIYLNAIERSANAQVQLIADLLDVSRIVTGKLTLDISSFELESAVDGAIESVRFAAEAKGIELKKTIEENIKYFVGDQTRIQQIIWNLLSNAIKFTSIGGKVHILVKKNGSNIVLTVCDTGKGIEAESLPHIFDRFHQEDSTKSRRYEGLGLGLSIVRHLVELHGGAVTAESQGKEKGAVFTVSLPIQTFDISNEAAQPLALAKIIESEIEKSTKEEEYHLIKKKLEGRNILMIDDHLDARVLVAKALRMLGVIVDTKSSGIESLQVLAHKSFDAIICDIGMPEMNGIEFIKKLRVMEHKNQRRNIPALALTAYATDQDRLEALEAGYQIHIAKPAKVSELFHAVAQLCE